MGKFEIDLIRMFRRHEKRIGSYIDTRVSTYFNSQCYRTLKNRMNRLRSSLDMRYHKSQGNNHLTNNWKAKIGVPLVREAFLAQRASLFSNFRNDPLLSVTPLRNTPYENARAAQDLLTSNMRSTRFRAKCYNSLVNTFSRYGSAVSMCYWQQNSSSAMYTEPKRLPDGRQYGYERVRRSRTQVGANNRSIHILNYFQNPRVADPEESDYQGHVERWRLSDLMAEAEAHPDLYVKENVEKVIREAQKDATIQSEHYYDYSGDTNAEWQGTGIDIVHWWGTLNINGNERDQTTYYVERVGDTIIRFQDNPNDGGVRPYSVFAMDPREEYWWGNTTSENQIMFENAANVFLNMYADAGLQAMQRFVFYNKDMGLNPAQLNQAAKTGGFVPVTMKRDQDMSKVLFPWQRTEVSGHSTQYALSEIKEAAQRVRPKADFTRSAVQGGPQNKTATAALAMSQQGDIQENYYFAQFEYGLKDIGLKDLRMLQTYLPDEFSARPKANVLVEMDKGNILGDFDFMVQSTLTKNQQIQAMNLINTLTAIMNFKGSGDPSWQQVQLMPIIRAWFREIDLPIDVDEVVPDEAAMMGMQGMPGMGAPGPMGGAPAGPAGPAAPQQMGAPNALAMA